MFFILAGMVVRDLLKTDGSSGQEIPSRFWGFVLCRLPGQLYSGVYEAIKQAQDMQAVLPVRGEYEKLLRTVQGW